jgi:succinate dehydrogenase/fumarate reductase flavoprotein subunit
MTKLPMDIVRIDTDVVVVGGGGAASRAALSARQHGANVHLVTKAAYGKGGSTVHGASEIMSMGAAAGFGDARDQPQVHFDDTMRAGEGFIDPDLVRVLAEDAPERMRDLLELGVPFDKLPVGSYKLIKSDFGTYGRCAGVKGKTGKAFVRAIADEMKRLGVHIDAPVMLVDILRDADGAISGILAFDSDKQVLIHYRAPSVVLATGGIHGAFSSQVSTPEMTGDGQAIAYRHGAELVNLEFHQFGPALLHPYIQLFSKSCFVLEPKMTNAKGEEFLPGYLPEGIVANEVYQEKVFPFTTSNASRFIDISIAREVREGRGTPHGGIWFSFKDIPEADLDQNIPNTMRWMKQRGVDPRSEPIEVGIAFQCMNGGVRMMDATAESSIKGLFVVGEVAGGVRGPDRPGGNSLAEGQVFGHRAGCAAAKEAAERNPAADATLDESLDFLSRVLAKGTDSDFRKPCAELRGAMQRECLVEKSADGLAATCKLARELRKSLDEGLSATPETLIEALSTRNLAQSAELVLTACLDREETRSGHLRTDFPKTDEARFGHSFTYRRGDNSESEREILNYRKNEELA